MIIQLSLTSQILERAATVKLCMRHVVFIAACMEIAPSGLTNTIVAATTIVLFMHGSESRTSVWQIRGCYPRGASTKL